ncbi:MAG: nucleotide exchange factor GrpE [Candidatus Woykebacteria bacterium]
MVKKVKKSQKNNNQLEEQLKRALADYANLQRRVEEDKKQMAQYLKGALFIELLPVLDNLEKSAASMGKETPVSTKQGLEMSIDQFKKLLAEEGIEEIRAEDKFDPRIHEAVEVVPGKESDRVIEVVERGYQIGERILRPAKVRVGKRKESIG